MIVHRVGCVAGLSVLAVAGLVLAAPAAGVSAKPLAKAVPTPWTISTVAGGVGGPAKALKVAFVPCGVSYGAGTVFAGQINAGTGFQGDGAIRKLNPATDWLTTPVGTGAQGPLGDRGQAARATLTDACSTAVDHAGNLVIADAGDNRVRVVAAHTAAHYGVAMTAGHIYTVAGDGTAGGAGDGGRAISAELDDPTGVAVDRAGNLVIADTGSNEIRVVAGSTGTFYGITMTAHHIYRVAGDGTAGFGGDGGPATGAELHGPSGVAVDGAGNLLTADAGNNRIRVVAASTGQFYGQAMTAGDIYTIAGGGTYWYQDGIPATTATFNTLSDVAVDSQGNVLITQTGIQDLRLVAARTGTFYGQPMTAGDIYTLAGRADAVCNGLAGDGGPATKASLCLPSGVAADAAGNLLIADEGNARIRVIAASTGTFYGQAMTAGNIYTIAGNGSSDYSGVGGPARRAEMFYPSGITTDHSGNIVVADDDLGRVLVVAAATGTFYGQQVTAGHIYTVAGNGTFGYSGDGGPATGAAVRPYSAVVDAAGNLLISGDTSVRVVAVKTGTFYGQAMTAGDIYTIAGGATGGFSGDGGPATKAELSNVAGVTVDSRGNVVIADYGNNRVRVVAGATGTSYDQKMTAGNIYTVAGGGTGGDGGPATKAHIRPAAVALDAAGNLVIADVGDCRLRLVADRTGTYYGQRMTAADIYTVAGDGNCRDGGDGGPATRAQLNGPFSVMADGAGNLVIGDDWAVRVVAARSGTYYGQPMTTGNIYTVAGNGTFGYAGDGGPAIHAELAGPVNVAMGSGGELLIADIYSSRIRTIRG